MGNFTIPYAISFVGYFSLSVATLIILSNYKGCYVRHTYKPEFLAGTASNPFFTSTQIIRHPPGVGSDDPQRAADIGAFPVIISHPYRDAAFLPVRKDDSPSLNSLFSVLPRGGIQKMLDALHSSDEEGFTVQAAHELMAKDLAALHAIMAVHSDVYNLSAASTWSRGDEVLHLLKNGMVVSPQQTMYMDTAGMMTSMLTQGMGWLEGHGNGMLPNIGRCVKPIEHRPGEDAKEKKHREYEWLSDLSDYSIRSRLKGACLMSGQQDVIDVSTNHKASAVLFSSVNMMYISLVVAWISASFSLFYSMNKLVEGYEDLLVGVAVAWNVILAGMSLVPSWYNDYNIPLNNIILTLVLLGLSITVHCLWSSGGKAVSARPVVEKAFFKAVNTDLYMANPVRIRATQKYMSELEQTQDTDVVRCIEYAIVDPLLFASVLISAAPSVPTGIVQLCYATMMGFHLLCIPLLRIGAVSGSIDNGNVMKQAAQEATVVTIFAVLILMIISISTFLAYGHSYAWTYDPDPVVLALVWTLAVVQALRSILIIAEPMLKSKGLLQDGTKTQTFRMFSTPSHALLTLTMRFASIVMIIVATVDKRFSHGDCNMWS